MSDMVYTIGHSNHEFTSFIRLVKLHGITAVADVRSQPYSRFFPHFRSAALKRHLFEHGIAYLFVGKELGGRSDDPACYRHGIVQYDLVAAQPRFREGLHRLLEEMKRHCVTLLCAEKEPLNCHRALLVGRNLVAAGVDVGHIHADGSLESHPKLESRLLAAWRLPDTDMFTSRNNLIAEAYRMQGERVAYKDPSKQ